MGSGMVEVDGAAVRSDPAPALGYQPALDGLRAVAVAMVLLFHADVAWMSGGYLGVSVFFTLSGYLITSILLREVRETGSVSIGAFYARRARRLLPASALCLVAVALAARNGLFPGVLDLRRDLLGALFQVANWVQLFDGESYADLMQHQAGRASPLEHYWSLAIEEQLYWIWPVVVAGLARRVRRGATWSRPVGAVTALLALSAPVIALGWGPDAAYWATPARAVEVLAGALLACLAHEGRVAGVPRWLAPGCLAALAVLAVVLPADGGFAYRGGLPLVAVLSAGLVHGLQAPGLVHAALSLRPFVALGRISYGVYLFHWPIYVVLDEGRTGWEGPALLGLRLAVTVAVATASYVVIERPVREAKPIPRRTAVGAVAVAGLTAAVIAFVPVPDTSFGPEAATAAEVAIQPVGELDGTAGPVRIMVVGDSTAQALGAGMVEWAGSNPGRVQVSVRASPGCGFLRSGEVPNEMVSRFQERCDQLFARLPSDLAQLQPDVVVLLTWWSDGAERSWDGGPLLYPQDTEFRRHLIDEYAGLTDLIASTSGAIPVWVRPPLAEFSWTGEPDPLHAPERQLVIDEVAAQVVAARAGGAAVVDLRAHLEANGLLDDPGVRPDGIHLSLEAATALSREWLGPELIDLARSEPL